MGPLLAVAGGMRTIGLLMTLLAVAPQAVTEQQPAVPAGTIITAAQVAGFDIDRLSPGLRQEIRGLAGQPFDQLHVNEIAARIEAERPRYVAAVRAVMEGDGKVRVYFLVGRQGELNGDDNVNARYIVEHAEITGISDTELTQALRDDLEALVGKRLDSGEAERLQARIEQDLESYQVSRRIQRGSERGRIRLVYEARKREPPPWLRFEPLRSNALFHSDQGWGAYLDLGIGDRKIRFTPIVALDNADDLVEEYSGVGLRFEANTLGTRRLGASIEWSWFDQNWRDETVRALATTPGVPPPYDTRTTITPLLKFAFTPDLSVAGGVSISELNPLSDLAGSEMANSAVASVDFVHGWKTGSRARQHVEASFGIRAGAPGLESDLDYTRYLGQGSYRYTLGRHEVQATGMAGGISGDAPLFERFTLGDSTTLRGWDKYEIAPAGGDRLAYSSIEYRYTGLALFLDVGSVWDAHTERHVRVSTGFGFHAGPSFLVVGIPLNTDNLTAVLTFGLRIPGVGIRW